MIYKDWIRQLQTTPYSKISQYTVGDYLWICRLSLLKPTVIALLDKLRENPEVEDQFLVDLYILAFVYRKTSRFEAIVKGGKFDPPLLPDYASKDYSVPEKENESVEDMTNPFFKTTSELLSPRAKISQLRAEANRFREKISKLAESCLDGSSTKYQCKKDKIYRKIYNQSLAVRCNIAEVIRKIADEQNMTYESLHRGYYRWLSANVTNLNAMKGWPTAEFNYFCALLSVVYLPDDPQASTPLYILSEGIIWEVNLLRKALRECFVNDDKGELLKKRYDRAKTEKDRKLKEQQMIKLARENYLPAVKECISLLDKKFQEKYSRQAAILGDQEIQKQRGWKASGLEDIVFAVAAKNKLKLARTINFLSAGITIKKGSLVYFIRFDANINSDEMDDVRSQLQGVSIGEPESFEVFMPSGSEFHRRPVCRKSVCVKVTAKNFDILMQHADILPTDVRLCFSSQHPKKEHLNNQVVYALIARTCH